MPDIQEESSKKIDGWKELIASTTVKLAKQVTPVVERGSRTLLGWAVKGLKAGADYLDDVHKKLEKKREK